MTGSQSQSSRAAHWESFWREAEDDAQAMGSAGKRLTLHAFWQDFFARQALSAQDFVLDIASGAAPIARSVEDTLLNGGPTYVAADYAVSALQTARRLCKGEILATAADAASLPFAPNRFAAVISQFGIEYAGEAAFAEAAEMLAPGGAFAAIAHLKGGAIEWECAENAKLLEALRASDLIEAARKALSASYAARGAATVASGPADPAAEAAFKASVAAAKAHIERAPAVAARDLLARFFNDLVRLSERRLAFAPEDALGWLTQFAIRLDGYYARMKAMSASALSADEVDSIRNVLDANGIKQFKAEPVVFEPGSLPGAWKLSGRRQN